MVRGRGACCDGEREAWEGGREVREKPQVRFAWIRCQGLGAKCLNRCFGPRKTPMPSPAPKQTIHQTQRHGF